MKQRTSHRTQALLLAVVLGLAMSLWFAPGSAVATEIAVAADPAHRGPCGCAGCGGGDHEDIDVGACMAACGIAAQGLVPGELLTPRSASRADFQITQLHLSGEFHSPERGPPKVVTLG
jgi:hypothetical protein